jgi:hypothetical protein
MRTFDDHSRRKSFFFDIPRVSAFRVLSFVLNAAGGIQRIRGIPTFVLAAAIISGTLETPASDFPLAIQTEILSLILSSSIQEKN